MADKFKQERAENLTKPGEKPVDSADQNDISHRNERDSNVTKPGEKPVGSEKSGGNSKGNDAIEGASSFKPVEWDDSEKLDLNKDSPGQYGLKDTKSKL